MAEKPRKTEPRAESLDDRLDKEALAAAADKLIAAIKALLAPHKNRLLKTLTRAEVEQMAQAAIVGWIARRVEQAKRSDVEAESLDAFILACSQPPRGYPELNDSLDDLL